MTSLLEPAVGFIGLGIMGLPMAANVQKAGFRLVVHDRRRETAEPLVQSGATWASTPREVAELTDVIFTCLPGAPQVEQVALGSDGVHAGIRPGRALFDLSTGPVDFVKSLHAAFAQCGAHVLDAPISGGARGAQTGQLAIWVGGEKSVYMQFETVLRSMGDRPLYMGSIGSGLVAKLVNNCASQATQAAIVEAFVLGVKAGADPLFLWKAIRQGAVGRRRTFDGLIEEFLPGSFDTPQAALSVAHKDVLAATEMARTLGVPMRIAELTLADIQEAMNRGWSERDCRSVMLLPQERVGIRVKVDPNDIQEVLSHDPPAGGMYQPPHIATQGTHP